MQVTLLAYSWMMASLAPRYVTDIPELTTKMRAGRYVQFQLLLRIPGLLTMAVAVVPLDLLELRNFRDVF